MDFLNLDKSGWRKFRFDEIAQNISQRVEPQQTDLKIYVGLEHLDAESLHIKRWGTPADVEGTKLKAFAGDLIFGKRRAYQRKAAVTKFDCICSAHAMVLRANPEVIDPQLFPFFIHSDAFMHRAVDISVGSLSPTINWSTLREQQFHLPPKDQQARLAELLWSGDLVLEGQKKLEQSLLKLEAIIFEDFLKECKHLDLQNTKNLLIDGPRNGFSPNSNLEGSGSKTVSIGAIQKGRFSPEGNVKFSVVENEVLRKFNLVCGDVLVVRGNGNRTLCGRAGLVMKDYPDFFYPDLLIRLRFDSQKVLPRFATFQWNQPKIHGMLLQKAKSTNGIYKINGEDLKNHSLLIPPIEIQKKIVQKLDIIQTTEIMSNIHENQTKTLQTQLLNQIFSE